MDKKNSNRTKSYTSIYDSYKSPDKYSNKLKSIENYLYQIGNLPFKTSDKYEKKGHKNKGDKTLVDSASTIFYDLDTIAKRKSLNCISDITLTNKKVLNTKYHKHSPKADLKTNYKVYPARTHSIGSVSNNDKPIPVYTHEIRKLFPHDSEISSNFNTKNCDRKTKHKKDRNTNDQKWKHIKYHVGSCSPVIDKRRKKNKDHACGSKKHAHQEYFYCNKRSIENLNNSMKTAKDQISDVSILAQQHKIAKLKVLKHDSAESPPEKGGGTITEKSTTEDSFNSKYLTKNIMRRIKKHCQITCPNCNKQVLVATADEDKTIDSKNTSGRYNSIELSKTLNYRYVPYNVSDKNNNAGCGHEPQCDMIPMCQMLHSVQSPITSKGARNSGLRSPRVLRVTKACRHHPPCTMVPSCQRLKVLKNNCQYFPECPHRPRCMNLPLCAPISKATLEQFTVSVNDTDNGESQIGQFKYIPVNEQSTGSTLVYQPCDFAYPTAPTFFVQPKMSPKSFSPYESLKPTTAPCPKLNQSCQYDCVTSNDNTQNDFKEDNSEGVIYIRDVGCQFRNKYRKDKNKCYNSRDSKSSTTGDNESSQMTNDSLQSDEKVACLSPEVEVGSTDLSSIDETSHTTSNGQNNDLNHRREIPSGFIPQATTAQFIAYSTRTEPILANCLLEERNTDGPFCETYASPARVMSRRSFLKQKYKKMFCVRRRRRSKINQTGCCPIRKLTHQHVMK